MRLLDAGRERGRGRRSGRAGRAGGRAAAREGDRRRPQASRFRKTGDAS